MVVVEEREEEGVDDVSVLEGELVTLIRDATFLTEPVESKVCSFTH